MPGITSYAGEVRILSGIAANEHDSEVSERSLRILVDASAALLAVSDVDTMLGRVLECAKELISADACGVWRSIDGGYNWRMLASAGLTDTKGGSELKVPDPSLIPEVSAIEDVRSFAVLADRVAWYDSEQIRSLICVTLRIGDSLAASVTFYCRNRHAFTQDEIQFARMLANLSASTLYMSELQLAQQRERTRLKFLAEASAILASSLHYEETLQTIARLAVPYLADCCTVSMHEGGRLTALAIAHVDPEKERKIRDLSSSFYQKIRDGSGSGNVLATGKSILRTSVTDEYLVSTAQNDEHLAYLRWLGLTSLILLPLKSRDRVIGVMRLSTAQSARRFTEDDLSFAEDLAARASTAIENAQLFRELELSESRFRSLIDATSSLAWTSDPEGKFVEPQPAWSAYCGQTWEELRDHGWANALHPDDRDRLLREVIEGTEDKQEFRGRLWHAASKTYRHCTVRAVPMKDEAGQVQEWVGVLLDIHDLMLAEEKLRRTEQLATAGRLAATVAHEINNPLESVTNLVYLAQQAPVLDEHTRGYLDTAAEEMQRVAQIVRQTLGFYRENSAPKDADIGEIAMEVLDLYRRNFMAKGLHPASEIDAKLMARVVPGEIRQVVANLIANAIDASDAGGEIRVTVKQQGEDVMIRVTDQGTGISKESLDHLFEPFFTTKKELGTGLGLWVSRGLIDKHNGTLTLETKTGERDHGTAFTILLPVDGGADGLTASSS
jgi:PAS domain S-box-containing protein